MRKIFQLVGEITLKGYEGADKKIKAIDREATKLSRSIAKMGKKVEAAGVSITKHLTLPIVALGAAALKTKDAASDLGETVSKVGEIFGESAKDIEKWADTAATRFGQSKTQAMDAASTFAIFGQSAGLAGQDLVKFSTEFTELASDLASFNNTSPEEAIIALGAALRGENEPIRRYGVLLDAATMKQKALEMGIISSTKKALTPQQKVLAAQALILEQTTIAQGDFARTADQAANKERILTARIKDRSAALGKGFLPIWLEFLNLVEKKLLPAAEKLIKWFNSLEPEVRKNIVVVTALLGAVGPLLIIIGKLIAAFKILAPIIGVVKIAMLGLNAAMLANPFMLAVAGVGLFAAAITGAVVAYKNLRKEHEKWSVITAEQAQINTFTAGVDKLTQTIQQNADKLTSDAAAQKLLGDQFEELTAQARELGFTVEGDLQTKLDRLTEISNSLKGSVMELGKGLVKASKDQKVATEGEKAAAEIRKQLTEEEKKRLAKLKETREKFENAWSEKLLKETGSRLEILEHEKKNAIKKAEELGADKNAIVNYYVLEEAKIREEGRAKQLEEEAAAAKKREEFENHWMMILAQNQNNKFEMLEMEKQTVLQNAEEVGADKTDILKFYAQKEKEIIQDTAKTYVDLISSAVNQLSNIWSGHTDNQIANIDARVKREKKAVEESALNEQDKQAKIEAIEAEADAKKLKLQRKQAQRDKLAAIFGAVINTAQAITKALTLGVPAGIIFAAIMGALGAAQIAVIASKPLPFAKGGMIKGGRGGVTGQIGEGDEDELVLPLETGVETLANQLMKKLAAIEIPDFNLPAPEPAGAAGAGFAGETDAAQNVTEMHIHAGIIIADDPSLKMLWREMRKYEIEENQRRGAD